MSGRLEGRIAVVMGAGCIGEGWGNGKATAVLFAREGAAVACVDRNLDAADETARFINGEGGTAFAMRADVTTAKDIDRVTKEILSRHGGIDILQNNVGIADPVTPTEHVTEESWDRVLDVNLKSVFLT